MIRLTRRQCDELQDFAKTRGITVNEAFYVSIPEMRAQLVEWGYIVEPSDSPSDPEKP